MKTERYRLYAAKPTDETMAEAMNSRYGMISSGYVLIYKSGKGTPPGFKEMGDKEVALLAKRDLRWLAEINIQIMEEFVAKHREAEKRARMKFLADFEAELQAEEAKLMEEKDHAEE